MVFREGRLLPLDYHASRAGDGSDFGAAGASGGEGGVLAACEGEGDDLFVAWEGGGMGLLSLGGGLRGLSGHRGSRSWRSRSSCGKVKQLAYVSSTGSLLALEVAREGGALFLVGYEVSPPSSRAKESETSFFSISLAAHCKFGVMGVCRLRSRVAVATGSDIHVWDISRGGSRPDHVFEISLQRLLGGGLSIRHIALQLDLISFATEGELFVLCPASKENRHRIGGTRTRKDRPSEGEQQWPSQKQGRPQSMLRRFDSAPSSDSRWTSRHRAGRSSSPSSSPVSGRNLMLHQDGNGSGSEMHHTLQMGMGIGDLSSAGFCFEREVKDDPELVVCLFEELPATLASQKSRTSGRGSSSASHTASHIASIRCLPTFLEDASGTVGIDDVDRIMLLQRVTARDTSSSLGREPNFPSQYRVALARRCRAGSQITKIEFVGNGENYELLVSTWKASVLYTISRFGGRNEPREEGAMHPGATLSFLIEHPYRALHTAMIPEKPFLYCLTLAGIEVWTLPDGRQRRAGGSGCYSPRASQPVLLHCLELRLFGGVLPRFPHKLMIGLKSGLILIPGNFLEGRSGERIGGLGPETPSSVSGEIFWGFDRPFKKVDAWETSSVTAEKVPRSLQLMWTSGCITNPLGVEEPPLSFAVPLALQLQAMSPMDVYYRVQASVREWLDRVRLERERLTEKDFDLYISLSESLMNILLLQVTGYPRPVESNSVKLSKQLASLKRGQEASRLARDALRQGYRSAAADCASLLAEIHLESLDLAAKGVDSDPSHRRACGFEAACKWLRRSSKSLCEGVRHLRKWLTENSCGTSTQDNFCERILCEDYIIPYLAGDEVMYGGRYEGYGHLFQKGEEEELEKVVEAAIDFLKTDDQPPSALARFIVLSGRVPWELCLRTAQKAKSYLEETMASRKGGGDADGDRNVAVLVLCGYLGIDAPDGSLHGANDESLLDACRAHPQLVVERREDRRRHHESATIGVAAAGPLAQALFRDERKVVVLLDALLEMCRSEEVIRTEAEDPVVAIVGVIETLSRVYSDCSSSSFALELFLFRCTVQAAMESEALPPPSAVLFRNKLSEMFFRKIDGGRSSHNFEMMRQLGLAQAVAPPPSWALNLTNQLLGDNWRDEVEEERLYYFHLLLGLFSPRLQADGSGETEDRGAASSREAEPVSGEERSLKGILALIMRVAAGDLRAGLPLLTDAISQMATVSARAAADILFDYTLWAADVHPERWRAALGVLREVFNCPGAQDAYQRALHHVAAQGSPRAFLESMPDSTPLHELLEGMQRCSFKEELVVPPLV